MATNAARMLTGNENPEADEVEYGNSNEVSGNQTAHEFIAVLLQAARATHEMHLSTRSVAEHLALNELYDGLPDRADTIAETYQGRHGLIQEYPAMPPMPPVGNCVKFVQGLVAYVDAKRDQVSKAREIQNEIDDVLTLLNRTLYKLKFLS